MQIVISLIKMNKIHFGYLLVFLKSYIHLVDASSKGKSLAMMPECHSMPQFFLFVIIMLE